MKAKRRSVVVRTTQNDNHFFLTSPLKLHNKDKLRGIWLFSLLKCHFIVSKQVLR